MLALGALRWWPAPVTTGQAGAAFPPPAAMGRIETSDGYIVLGAADDHHFRAFRELMGKLSLGSHDRWDNRYYRLNHLHGYRTPDGGLDAATEKGKDHRAAKAKIPIGPFNTAEALENRERSPGREEISLPWLVLSDDTCTTGH